MTKINPYLTFSGNCETAFNFYKSIFGGEFQFLGRFSEIPEDANIPIPEEDKNLIMHISLPIGDAVLMGSDSISQHNPSVIAGTNFSISITAETKADADRFFNSLSAGGESSMPMQDTFWGAYFGMCKDKFDIHWMISFNPNQP